MKALFGIAVLLVVAALAGAAYYLKLSLDLPELSTENQVVDLVGRSVEAYRAEQAHDSGGTTARFAVTAREVLKSPVGQALLVRERCPDYLAAPPPPELDFWRAQLQPATGATFCAVGMSMDLAQRLLLPSVHHVALAADRIREALGRDGLFAVWASAVPFNPDGPQGVEPASRALFHAAPQDLDWEGAAELAVAMTHYQEVAICAIPPQLTALRDRFLERAAVALPAEAPEIQAAEKKPLRCVAAKH